MGIGLAKIMTSKNKTDRIFGNFMFLLLLSAFFMLICTAFGSATPNEEICYSLPYYDTYTHQMVTSHSITYYLSKLFAVIGIGTLFLAIGYIIYNIVNAIYNHVRG
jgi:hypothetical protein